MKKLITVLFLFSITCTINAQTFPQSGATWIFEHGFTPWVDTYAEKWEVFNVNGEMVTMKITSKSVNPGWYPWDTTEVGIIYKDFKFSGDTVWMEEQSLHPIANFSLQVGDSTYTPYYTQNNLDFWDNCDSAVSFLSQKGWVIQAGTETADGITSRYYDLAFLNEYEVIDTLRFSERSIITSFYWNYTLFNFNGNGCGGVIDGAQGALVCYYDNAFTGNPCPEIAWFEHLSVDENANAWVGKIYPNPVSDLLNVSNPTSESLKAYITDIQGRKVKDNIQLLGSTTSTIQLSDLAPGIYLLNMVLPGVGRVQEKFLKVE